ncbi:NTP transferase domain-containing protein [Flavobacterium sp.]|uniref:nucleotidyltransferase family protein n=1 Tax=Flavobacterium sp. TaxID=239 RepID=UPI00286E4F36|nr:NTP transferase domain-containing protein [Flavobacterium sp.]
MENNLVFVVLAGGKSERIGLPKGLLLYQENFWIMEQLNRISNSTITSVFIGLGFYYEKYLEAVPWLRYAQDKFVVYKNLKIKVVINTFPEKGSFSTLQAVLFHIPKNSSVLIQPIDVPILNAVELYKIIDAENEIVLPNYQGKSGHPIKVSPQFWKHFLELDSNDQNTRLDFQIKKAKPFERTSVSVDDASILQNLNSPKDWSDFVNANK